MMQLPNICTFSDSEVALLSQALALAWDRVLNTDTMDEWNMEEAQQILAHRILSSATDGQWDPWKLAREALFNFWELKFAGRPLIKVAPRK